MDGLIKSDYLQKKESGNHKKEFFMNKFKFLGIIALIAIIGFSMVACIGDDDTGDDLGQHHWPESIAGPTVGSQVFWDMEGESRFLAFANNSSGVALIWINGLNNFYIYSLVAINGNTYTVRQGQSADKSFTAIVGSDGKLTVSGFSDFDENLNGTYTRRD